MYSMYICIVYMAYRIIESFIVSYIKHIPYSVDMQIEYLVRKHATSFLVIWPWVLLYDLSLYREDIYIIHKYHD